MTSIYEQHDKAFEQVSAYVVLKDGEKVATVAIKYPRDGAGRLWAYVHWIGLEMVRGYAGGYGYDKRTAACASAARKLREVAANASHEDGSRAKERGLVQFEQALATDGGRHWDDCLRDAGFTVLQAV